MAHLEEGCSDEMTSENRFEPRAISGAHSEPRFQLSAKYLWILIVYGIPAMAVLSIIMTEIRSLTDNFIIEEIADRFILNNETSIPTLLSYFLMFTAAQLSILVFLSQQRNQRALFNLYWLLIALFFLVLAYDEVAQIHEKIPPPISKQRFKDHGWVFAGAVVALLLAICFIPFFRRGPKPLAKQLFWGAAIFLFGAIVIEAMSGLYADLVKKDRIYSLITVLEESVELLGIAYLNAVLVEHLGKQRFVLDFVRGDEHRLAVSGTDTQRELRYPENRNERDDRPNLPASAARSSAQEN